MHPTLRQTRRRLAGKRGQRGMTLIEIMIVITILGMVAAAVAVAVVPQLKEAKVKTAKMEIQTIANAADLYYNKFSKYPGSDEGISALVQEKMLKQNKPDPWGNPYVYRFPGVKNPDGPDIGSYGSDGQPGGTGDASDLFLGDMNSHEGK